MGQHYKQELQGVKWWAAPEPSVKWNDREDGRKQLLV